MKTGRLAVLAPLIFALSLIGLSHSPTPALGENINLFLMGDSITDGGYYVTTLQSMLASSGYNATMLGKCSKEGWTISDLQNNMNTWTGYIPAGETTFKARQNLNLPGVNQPNTYILLLIGTNDVGGSASAATAAPSKLSTLITAIQAKVPLAKLIVGNLTPRADTTTNKDRIPVFNSAFTTVTQNMISSGANFTTVDLFTPMNANPAYYLRVDGVHPNTQYGHPLMAGVWYDGVMSVAAPEPGSLTLLVVGAVGLLSVLAFLWRRKRMATPLTAAA